MNVENTNHLILHLAVLQWVLLDTMHSESRTRSGACNEITRTGTLVI